MKNMNRPADLSFITTAIVLLTFLGEANSFSDEVSVTENDAEIRQRNHSIFFGYGKPQSVEAINSQLGVVLKHRIEAIDRACGLTDPQKEKLELAGLGSIKQLFERIEDQKRTLTWTEQKNERGTIRFLNEVPAISILRSQLRSGPFTEDSIFAKTLRKVLTPEQQFIYDDRERLAATSNKQITAANVMDLVRTNVVKRNAFRIVFNREGTLVGIVDSNDQVDVYDPKMDIKRYSIGEGKRIVAFDFSSDKNVVAFGQNSTIAAIFNVVDKTEKQIETAQQQPRVIFSPDGKSLCTGGYGKSVKLWSVSSGELIREFDIDPEEGGLTPVFSPDGTILAVGHRNSNTRMFNVNTGRLLHTLPKSMSHELKFDSSGKTLAIAYVNGHLAVWDVKTGELIKEVKAWAEELYTVDWSPDSSMLVTAGLNSQVSIWSAMDLSLLREVESPEWVISTRFSPDGTKLFFAGGGRSPISDRWVEIRAVP
jgi:WD40 repeat protein